MPRVNLVPKEERAREFRRQFLIIPIAGAAVIVIGMAAGYVYYSQQLNSAEDELQQYKDNNASQRDQVEELDRYEAIGQEKQEKEVQVMLLESQRHKWSRTLDDIAFVVPDDIWFKEIEGKVPWLEVSPQDARAAGQVQEYDFTIEGRTQSMASIAVFMVRLGLIPSLENVELIFAEQVEEESTLLIQFEIGASLVLSENMAFTAVAPSTGETGPSDGTGTGTGTSTTSTDRDSTGTTETGTTGTTGTSTGSGR